MRKLLLSYFQRCTSQMSNEVAFGQRVDNSEWTLFSHYGYKWSPRVHGYILLTIVYTSWGFQEWLISLFWIYFFNCFCLLTASPQVFSLDMPGYYSNVYMDQSSSLHVWQQYHIYHPLCKTAATWSLGLLRICKIDCHCCTKQYKI